MESKDIILFINNVPPDAFVAVKTLEKQFKKKLKIAVVYNRKQALPNEPVDPQIDYPIFVEAGDDAKLAKALLPFQDRVYAVTCRSDKHIPFFASVVAHLPYARTPSSDSLRWSSDKLAMRRHLAAYDKTISPEFMVVSDITKATLKKIRDTIGFPLVIKPTGLASSLLVTICFHKEELESSLKTIMKKIQQIYKENNRTGMPQLLVEEFMEGDMYSIDAYVSGRGRIYCCPPVHVKTGASIGFDDFFGYRQMTPTLLRKGSVEEAEAVTEKAIRALALANTSVHVELMKTEDGFKVIELAARVGGFRHMLYSLAFGIDHGLNDLLVRIPKKPIVLKKKQGYAAAMKFYAKKEGRLAKLSGIIKIQALKSLANLKVNKKIGDRCVFAKHGGKSVCDVILFNKSRSELLADIRRIEKLLVVVTE